MNNAGRVDHQEEVDEAITQWTKSTSSTKVLNALDEAGVPNGPINSIREIMEDPHFQARQMFEEVDVGSTKTLKIPAMVPKLVDTPGRTNFAGPELGQDNVEVLGNVLGFTRKQLEQLEHDGII